MGLSLKPLNSKNGSPDSTLYGVSTCPRCSTLMGPDRFVNGFGICSCGWHDQTLAQHLRKRAEHSTMMMLVCVAIVFTLGYGQMLNWGGHALRAPVLKAKQAMGTLSLEGHEELAQICIERNKWSCAEATYRHAADKLGDLDSLARLARLKNRIGDLSGSLETYAEYFKRGGDSIEYELRYAQLLENSGHEKEALVHFQRAARAQTDDLPLIATAGMIRLLMKGGRLAEARQRILEFHKLSPTAKWYFNNELSEITRSPRRAESHFAKSGVKNVARR